MATIEVDGADIIRLILQFLVRQLVLNAPKYRLFVMVLLADGGRAHSVIDRFARGV
jgi:hypothetical protein